jgi:hypothetical protein
MSENRFIWCAIFAVALLASCVSTVVGPRAKLEDHPDYARVEKRFDEVYHETIAQANPHQRAVFEKEHKRWFLDREKMKNDPDTYVAYAEQETRYFAGNYDEP